MSDLNVAINGIPFILMLYEKNGRREKYECNFPPDFIKKFDNKENSDIVIGFFFVMGMQTHISTIEEAIKFCKA